MVLLLPLLEGTDGKVKMSKSYPEHCINLTDAANEMFGKLMSVPDSLIIRYEQLLTPITEDQLAYHQQHLGLPVESGGLNPRDIKAAMAKWIITQYHGQEAANQAEEAFNKQFRDREIPEEIPELALQAGESFSIVSIMAEHGLAPSRGEARRLIQGGGVKLDQSEKIADTEATIQGQPGESRVLQVGKRRFLRLNFQ
jgi:tyrosyl-tRNA synthetase